MIHIEVDEIQGVATVRPQTLTGLKQTDFQQLAERIDSYLKDHEKLRGLVIVAEKFPGWESLSAFTSHIKLVRDHHKKIEKVAIVSDSPLLTAAPHLVDHFLNAKVRHFALEDIEKAQNWAGEADVRSGRFVILEGYPDNVLAIRAEGTITRKDYEETLIPLALEKIGTHGKVKMLYWCGPGFEGFSAGAMWDDARFGLMHMTDFSKIAFVSDVKWLRKAMKLFAPLVRMPVQLFHDGDIEDAKVWIIKDQMDEKGG